MTTAAQIFAFLEVDYGVRRRLRATEELVAAAAVMRADVHRELFRLAREVPGIFRALWNFASLDLMSFVRILGVTPRLIHARVGIAAVVVVTNTISPSHRSVRSGLVFRRGEVGCLLPRVSRGPLLASTTADRAACQTTVAPALGTFRFCWGVLDHVAIHRSELLSSLHFACIGDYDCRQKNRK